jgi:hypothetical protein
MVLAVKQVTLFTFEGQEVFLVAQLDATMFS